ncbi:FkbM family methyltransferase [Loktanella sp. DJP18]|uniref:FkbM family methyltransferase n=1 Tax=Loktanella sp. DJP18 TaxID=3409788 RepID=UPI003BB80772
MSMKVAFERFVTDLGFAVPNAFTDMPAPDFGGRFFEFARRNGYDIAATETLVFRHLGIKVYEVVDVGVHDGTPWLYQSFPDAKFLLVEPQRDLQDRLKSRPTHFECLNVAVGPEAGRLTLQARNERSSFLDRTEAAATPADVSYEVEVMTLDRILQDRTTADQVGLKIDIEGYEHFALQGLTSELGRIAFVSMEVSVRQRFKGEKTFSDIVSIMNDKGFLFYNLMNVVRPAPPNAYDVLFLPKDSPKFRT